MGMLLHRFANCALEDLDRSFKWDVMASSSDSEDDSFMAVDQEETVLEGTMEQEEESHPVLEVEETRHNRSMSELPEEVLEYILSFLSPYQEHKTAALVCKQWYRLIKGVAHQCYHGFMKAVQEGNIQWESRTYPYPGTPITQRFSHSACYYDANQSMYVFGGCTQSSCNAAFNDLWRLDLNSKEWIRPLASAVQRRLAATYAPRSLGLAATQGRKRRPRCPRTVVPSSLPGYDLKMGLSLAPRRGSLPDQKDLRLSSIDLNWDLKSASNSSHVDGTDNRTVAGSVRHPPEQTNGVHTPPHVASALAGAVSPSALRRSLEAIKAMSSKGPSASATLSPPLGSSPSSPGNQNLSSGETVPIPRPGPAQGDGHSLPPIARRLGHHPPQSLNVGKPLYQSMNCKPMQMYVLDIKDTKEKGRVKWKVFTSSSVVGPPETSLHTVVQGRGELIIFGGLMDKKQNVKYYPKTNALYFVRAKR
ncbi:F-box protein 42 [Cricetulus griseus]